MAVNTIAPSNNEMRFRQILSTARSRVFFPTKGTDRSFFFVVKEGHRWLVRIQQ
jgi:hypothetical protein